MKEVNWMKKGLISILLFSVVLILPNVEGIAKEAEVTEIIEDVKTISLPYDDEPLQVGEDLLVQLLKEQGIKAIPGSLDYAEKLANIQKDGIFLTGGINDQLILDYISFYLSEIATLQLLDESNQLEVNKAIEMLNQYTFSEKRLKNIESLQNFTSDAPNIRNPLARASKPSRSFSVTKANTYAARFAKGRNAIDYPTFSNDCTNFASQIARAGGMGTSNSYTNYSGGYWHPSVLSRNKAWFNASAFFNFFNAEGMRAYGASTKAEINKLADAGNMLCYIRRSTGAIDHVAYVNRKTSGKIYITQHTTDRKDEKLDNIDVFGNFNYVLVMKFKTW